MYDFTADDVAREVIKIAAERPDFVYTEQEGYDSDYDCGYAGRNNGYTEGEACIVGQAMRRLGATQGNLLRVDGENAASAIATLTGRSVRFSDRTHVEEWLDLVQEFQDAGFSWAEAVERADDIAGPVSV